MCIQDEANGWSEDLFTLRQSALNLLGIMALTKVRNYNQPVQSLNQEFTNFLFECSLNVCDDVKSSYSEEYFNRKV